MAEGMVGRNEQRVLLSLSALLILIGATFLASLYPRAVFVDDAWSGAHAYWLAKVGYVRSDLESAYWSRLGDATPGLFDGIEHEKNKLVVDHKLLTIHGGLLIRLFGLNFYLLKSLSLAYLIVVLWVARLIITRLSGNTTLWYRTFLVLFLFSPLTFEAAYRFRPEMMVAAFGMLSYQCLDTGVRARKITYTVLAGVMAGLAMSAHLNGVVYVVAGMAVIAGASRLPGLMAFAAGAGAGFLPYFYDLTSRADLSLWLVQFRHYPVMVQSNFRLLGWLLKPFHEVDRFVHKPAELVLSFLIVTIGFWSYRYLRTRCRQLLVYTICLMAGLAIFSSSRHPRYLMTYLPFLCILMGIGSEAIYTQVQGFSTYVRRYLVPFAMGAYLLVSYATILGVVAHDQWNMLASQRALSARMRPGSRVVAPIAFTFATIEHHSVQGLEFYEMLKERGLIPVGTTPFRFAAESGCDYLILDRGFVKRWHLADATSFGEYELVQRLPACQGREEYWLFERRAEAIQPAANRR